MRTYLYTVTSYGWAILGASFGTVIDGMDVIDAINIVEVAELCGDFRFGFGFAPIDTVIINSVRRVDETDEPPADEL